MVTVGWQQRWELSKWKKVVAKAVQILLHRDARYGCALDTSGIFHVSSLLY